MTPQQWYPQYLGKQVADNHGGYPGECVSFVKRYAQEALRVPDADSVLYVKDDKAKNAWLAPTPLQNQYFDKVNSPQNGDIAVYNGNYGDIAVYLGGNQVVGQYGTPVFTPVAVRPSNQPGVPLGYLRLKGGSMSAVGVTDRNLVNNMYMACFGRNPYNNQTGKWDDPAAQQYVGQPCDVVLQTLLDSKEHANYVKGLSGGVTPYSGPQLFTKG